MLGAWDLQQYRGGAGGKDYPVVFRVGKRQILYHFRQEANAVLGVPGSGGEGLGLQRFAQWRPVVGQALGVADGDGSGVVVPHQFPGQRVARDSAADDMH